MLGRILHTLIKGHCDGGAQVCLDLHTLLRAHKDAVAVQMRGKGHAFLRDLTQLGQAEHLESAAVGQGPFQRVNLCRPPISATS